MSECNISHSQILVSSNTSGVPEDYIVVYEYLHHNSPLENRKFVIFQDTPVCLGTSIVGVRMKGKNSFSCKSSNGYSKENTFLLLDNLSISLWNRVLKELCKYHANISLDRGLKVLVPPPQNLCVLGN